MKLTQLAAKPQLVKISLDDEDTIREYGEAVDFWMWDRQPMDQFVALATIKPEDFPQLVAAVNKMLLDEDGTPAIKDEQTLPTSLMTRVINKVVETLGK